MGLLIFFALLVGVYYACIFAGKILLRWLFDYEEEDKTVFIDRSKHSHTHFHVHTSEKSKEMKALEDYIEEGYENE